MNNLILTGFINEFSGLQQAESINGDKYLYLTFELRTDEALPQTPSIYLRGQIAEQFSSCQLTPQTQIRVYMRIYSRGYADHEGVIRKTNDISCWKIDVLDKEGNITFTARR